MDEISCTAGGVVALCGWRLIEREYDRFIDWRKSDEISSSDSFTGGVSPLCCNSVSDVGGFETVATGVECLILVILTPVGETMLVLESPEATSAHML